MTGFFGRAQRWDTIVVGLGVMGAATLCELARRGQRVLGLERFDVPHAFGSSHGGTRIIRKAYYEDPAYVPLLEESWEAWRRLEGEVGETLLLRTGGLHFGPADSPELGQVMAAAAAHGLAHEVLGATGIRERFPMFVPSVGDIGVVERDAGLLFAERSVMALATRAMEFGARIEARAMVLGLGLDGERVVVTTGDARHEADRVVLALGPWWPSYAPLRAPLPLTVTRQVQCWVAPADRAAFGPKNFPIFMRYAGLSEAGDAGEAARSSVDPLVYGLPEAHFPGLKLAVHTKGAVCDPESVDREVDAEDLAPIRRFIERHLPGAAGPLLGARVCMYTNTPDGHFGLGAHPDDSRVICAMGFSGHGFKLAPSVGRLLADCATGPSEGPAMPRIFALDRMMRA